MGLNQFSHHTQKEGGSQEQRTEDNFLEVNASNGSADDREDRNEEEQQLYIILDNDLHKDKAPILIPKNLTESQILQSVQDNVNGLEKDYAKKRIALFKKNQTDFVRNLQNYFKENPGKKDMPKDFYEKLFEEKWPIYEKNLQSLTL